MVLEFISFVQVTQTAASNDFNPSLQQRTRVESIDTVIDMFHSSAPSSPRDVLACICARGQKKRMEP